MARLPRFDSVPTKSVRKSFRQANSGVWHSCGIVGAFCHDSSRLKFRRCNVGTPGRGGRVAEGGGLLNRYRALKPYRGLESPPLRPRYGILIATPARETATSAHASAASAMPRIPGRARLGVAAATPSTASPATAV